MHGEVCEGNQRRREDEDEDEEDEDEDVCRRRVTFSDSLSWPLAQAVESVHCRVHLDEGSVRVPGYVPPRGSNALEHQTNCSKSTGVYFLQVKLAVRQ